MPASGKQKALTLLIAPEALDRPERIRAEIRREAGLAADAAIDFEVVRRSIDARRKRPRYVLQVNWTDQGTLAAREASVCSLQPVSGQRSALIVGAGPAGYFSALELIAGGVRPIILERGRPVELRRPDIDALERTGRVLSHSNYCFGEGGAGTYSDGKLYTRATKRGDVDRVLQTLVAHGADRDILVDAHPHIGSDRLPAIVRRMRETILACGGEIHFDAWVTDLRISGGRVTAAVTEGKGEFPVQDLILATGHSGRDIFALLVRKNIRIEAKPFAMGVRIEHPQALIDEIQYGAGARSLGLPPAAYRLVTQVLGRGVFSFCMCPGGFIVPAATETGEIVVNGMSLSGRDGEFANAGMVVEVRLEDVGAFPLESGLSAMAFQQEIERRAFAAGNGSLAAPGQRLTDFIAGKMSFRLPRTSYPLGVFPAPLHDLLPEGVTGRLKSGLLEFGKRLKGFVSEEAVAVGVETRTSSPVRIPRLEPAMHHPQVCNLYPCGEGAGHAGGIVSSALDGIRVASAIVRRT